MRQAILESPAYVFAAAGPIHGLQDEMPELKPAKDLWVETVLRINELEFVARSHNKWSACLRAHADPIHTGGHRYGPVRLDGDLESTVVKRVDEWSVELKKRFASRADDETWSALEWPAGVDDIREFTGGVSATVGSISADEVGITPRGA
jgi:hypothetical protein